MSTFTRDEIIAQLTAQGIPRHMAERSADAELVASIVPAELNRYARAQLEQPAVPRPQRFGAPVGVELVRPPAIEQLEAPGKIAWPLRLTLPWSLLVSDNERKTPYVVHTANGPQARMKLTERYAEAKQKIEQLARLKLAGAAAAEFALALTANVYVPGARMGTNDVINFAKGVHDALEKIVYVNDRLLHRVTWERIDVDVDAPRAELTFVPYVPRGG